MSNIEYSNERLLKMALTMLDVVREEQLKLKNPNKKWLVKNTTLEYIRQRVQDNDAVKS